MSGLDDLRGRLTAADEELTVLATEAADEAERARLEGKAQGVRLALSYLTEYRRGRPAGGTTSVYYAKDREEDDDPELGIVDLFSRREAAQAQVDVLNSRARNLFRHAERGRRAEWERQRAEHEVLRAAGLRDRPYREWHGREWKDRWYVDDVDVTD